MEEFAIADPPIHGEHSLNPALDRGLVLQASPQLELRGTGPGDDDPLALAKRRDDPVVVPLQQGFFVAAAMLLGIPARPPRGDASGVPGRAGPPLGKASEAAYCE